MWKMPYGRGQPTSIAMWAWICLLLMLHGRNEGGKPSEATFEAIQTRGEARRIRRDAMSTAGRYRPVKHPHEGGRTIERIPDRIEAKRHEAYMTVLTPIYNRSAKACQTKGQKHLREFEA